MRRDHVSERECGRPTRLILATPRCEFERVVTHFGLQIRAPISLLGVVINHAHLSLSRCKRFDKEPMPTSEIERSHMF
jgi:hypothetical protein